MNNRRRTFTTSAKLFIYPGEQGNWHFLTLPKNVAEAVRALVGKSSRGFGAIKVEVTIGETTWLTSIFPDRHSGSYFLPVKASVRKNEDLWDGEEVSFTIKIV